MSKRYPGITPKSGGRYLIRVKYIDPRTGKQKDKRKVITANNTRHANLLREQLRAELETVTTEHERVTVRQYARSWMRGKAPTLKASTRRDYAYILDNHILPVIGDFYFDSVRPGDIVQWRDSQTGRPATINSRMRVLKNMFSDATHELDLPRNPAQRVKALSERDVDRKPPHYKAEDLLKLLGHMKANQPFWYPMLLALLETGARFGEISALKWEDILWERHMIRICRSHCFGEVSTTKTGSIRTAPMSDELETVLRAHHKKLMAEQANGFEQGWVFPGERGTLIRAGALHHAIDRSLKAVGVENKKKKIHGLRFTMNNLLRQVAPGEVVRSITGHVSAEMTEHYSHVEDHEKRDAQRRALRLVWQQGGSLGGTSSESDSDDEHQGVAKELKQ